MEAHVTRYQPRYEVIKGKGCLEIRIKKATWSARYHNYEGKKNSNSRGSSRMLIAGRPRTVKLCALKTLF